jgi:IS5 family transposase
LRSKKDRQQRLEFKPSTLKITNSHYARYEAISEILDQTPAVLDVLHKDVTKALAAVNRFERKGGRPCEYTSENVLRIIVCQAVEGTSLREITVRIDDSNFFRRFVKIYDDPMMDFTVLCRLRNQIKPETWKKINLALAESALSNEMIDGAKLRLDTTAFETNIHWPSDSGLLWDVYRVLSRQVRAAREIDPKIGRERNLQEKHAKKLHTRITREASKKNWRVTRMKRAYNALFGLVEAILEMSISVAQQLRRGIRKNRYGPTEALVAEAIVAEIEHYNVLGDKVLDQAQRRVLEGEKVPGDEKIFSIFEPHTELLKRGKAGKDIEFGHMIHLQQVEGKFITDYEVFDKRPADHTLVDAAVKSHRRLFGHPPQELSGDKGFYQSMDKIRELEEEIELVSICKKGSRTAEEIARESSLAFKLAQAFRAGIEGSISFLKRVLRMSRCFVKGYKHYQAEVGRIVFAHNLIVLARGPTA